MSISPRKDILNCVLLGFSHFTKLLSNYSVFKIEPTFVEVKGACLTTVSFHVINKTKNKFRQNVHVFLNIYPISVVLVLQS